jgi:hypothetical protein
MWKGFGLSLEAVIGGWIWFFSLKVQGKSDDLDDGRSTCFGTTLE